MVEKDGLLLSDKWAALYEREKEMLPVRLEKMCGEKALFETADAFGLFGAYKAEILEAAEKLSENTDIAMLTALADLALEHRDTCRSGDTVFPIGKDAVHRYYTLLPVLHQLKNVVAMLRERGLPENIIRDTLTEYEVQPEIYRLHNGLPGFNKRFLEWTMLIAEDSLLRIGRFNFQPKTYTDTYLCLKNAAGDRVLLADGVNVHASGRILGSVGCGDRKGAFRAKVREDEAGYFGFAVSAEGRIEPKERYFRKAEWKPALQRGDTVLAVHIPRYSKFSLDAKSCACSYKKAAEVFAKHYPEYAIKAFTCHSWMMNRELQELLGKDSRIAGFQNRFSPFPIESNGQAIFSFIYQFPDGTDVGRIDYEALPEDTSLRRKVKRLLQSGGHIQEAGGIFLL